MKRFVNALFQCPRARALEEFFKPYLGLREGDLDGFHGTFQEVLIAQMVRRMRKEGCAHPKIKDESFESLRQALNAAESPTPPESERRNEPCKSRS